MAFATIDVTKGITGVTPVANGGTGLTSYTPGKVLQVVSATYSSITTTSSTSYVDTGITVNITPSATSSKVFVITNILGINSSSSTLSSVNLQLLRDTTQVAETRNVGYQDTALLNQGITLQTLDTPNTTSELTYKVQFSNRIVASVGINGTSDNSKITAFEVGA